MNVMTPGHSYRCGLAARWLPRAFAGAVLLGSMLVAFRFSAGRASGVGFPLQAFLILIGAALGLWILRSCAEVRVKVDLEDEQILFSYGAQTSNLALAQIQRFEFDHPMTASRRPLPAAVLIDDDARAWRLPVVLESGADLIEAIVLRSGRSDLETWAETLSLRRRMSRGGLVTALGYACALLLLAAAFWFYLH